MSKENTWGIKTSVFNMGIWQRIKGKLAEAQARGDAYMDNTILDKIFPRKGGKDGRDSTKT